LVCKDARCELRAVPFLGRGSLQTLVPVSRLMLAINGLPSASGAWVFDATWTLARIGTTPRIGSGHVTGGIHFPVGQAERGNHAIAAALGRTQSNEEHLVFIMFDDRGQFRFELNFLRRAQVAFKDRELKVIAKISADLKGPAQSLVIGDIVANQVGGSHRSCGWALFIGLRAAHIP
jgi:hypothetical protein